MAKKPKKHLNHLNDSIKINMLWKQKLNFDRLNKIREERAVARKGKKDLEKKEEVMETILMKLENEY